MDGTAFGVVDGSRDEKLATQPLESERPSGSRVRSRGPYCSSERRSRRFAWTWTKSCPCGRGALGCARPARAREFSRAQKPPVSLESRLAFCHAALAASNVSLDSRQNIGLF